VTETGRLALWPVYACALRRKGVAMIRILAVTALVCAAVSGWAQTVTVEVDAGEVVGSVRDLFGVNRKPTFNGQSSGTTWNLAGLYPAFGITQVRLHDSGLDLCGTYTAATKQNAGVSPPVDVAGCTLQGGGSAPHFKWTPTSSADSEINNTANYDFTSVDEALSAVAATGASLYLRLGDSYNGPNDTGDPVAWAKVATNVYKHVLGQFKPSAGIAIDPVYVEVHNEPDGAFWRGDVTTFDTLYKETVQRVREAAATAGRTVRIGGAGFTSNVLTSSTRAGNPANNFIGAVGAGNLDFYSAHHYNTCSTASLATSANFLRSLRTLVDGQGGSGKPLQITEWNIGLGEQCGNGFFAEQRLQSFTSAFLTLMQDPAQNIEAAHFYAAAPIMALFDTTASATTARINPSAWAFWAHTRLKGNGLLGTRVCSAAGNCAAGYAAETQAVLALAGQSGATQNIVVTNDGGTTVSYLLRVKGLATSAVNVTISTPPAGTRDLAGSGSPLTPGADAIAAALNAVSRDSRNGLPVSNGQIELPLTLAPHTLHLVQVQAPTAPVYRFYNNNAGGHFFTISESEKNTVIANYSWLRYEGIGFYAYTSQVAGTLPVYRFYNNTAGGHFFTISESEKATVVGNYHWLRYEGPGFYAYPAQVTGSSPVYRFYNNTAGGHFFTLSEAEKATVIDNYNWFRYEGVGFYGMGQ
jgi:hypothetical protein